MCPFQRIWAYSDCCCILGNRQIEGGGLKKVKKIHGPVHGHQVTEKPLGYHCSRPISHYGRLISHCGGTRIEEIRGEEIRGEQKRRYPFPSREGRYRDDHVPPALRGMESPGRDYRELPEIETPIPLASHPYQPFHPVSFRGKPCF